MIASQPTSHWRGQRRLTFRSFRAAAQLCRSNLPYRMNKTPTPLKTIIPLLSRAFGTLSVWANLGVVVLVDDAIGPLYCWDLVRWSLVRLGCDRYQVQHNNFLCRLSWLTASVFLRVMAGYLERFCLLPLIWVDRWKLSTY